MCAANGCRTGSGKLFQKTDTKRASVSGGLNFYTRRMQLTGRGAQPDPFGHHQAPQQRRTGLSRLVLDLGFGFRICGISVWSGSLGPRPAPHAISVAHSSDMVLFLHSVRDLLGACAAPGWSAAFPPCGLMEQPPPGVVGEQLS